MKGMKIIHTGKTTKAGTGPITQQPHGHREENTFGKRINILG